MMRTCSKCGKTKEINEAYRSVRKSGKNIGQIVITAERKDCKCQYCKTYYSKNKEKKKIWSAERYQRLKDAVFSAYGGYRCACCGETEPLFLTIDHIENNGSEHRKEIFENSDQKTGDYRQMTGVRTYRWLENNNFPAGYQILCANCNQGKFRNGGICPHKCSEGSTTIPKGSTPQVIGGGSAKPLQKQGDDIVCSIRKRIAA